MRPTLNVLGCGRLGSTLARLLTATGSVAPGGFFSRSQASAADARAFVGAGTVTATLTQLPDADLWLLAVPDGAIGEVAKQLAGLDRDWHGITVFHCSGLHDSSLLAPLAARGDADTVAQHLAAIAEQCPQYLSLYRTLGQLTADIVAPERSPEDDALAQIRALLAHQDH